MSLVLVLSSLAGCIAGEEEEDPTILVSTYHVAELVSAVAGDTLDVEIISPSNIPVHDYEPSAADIARLMDSEIFFYHGLNLEPWVDTTLDALGDDAPIAVMTHTMPTGQDTLDYESVLISNLCEVLTEGPFESTTLGAMSDDHDDHDDHGDEEDMVCYDMSTHTVDSTITTEDDCEAAGYMWTAANSGPGGDGDHDDEDGHDDHADEETLNYDPHSWLDPVAFKVQMNIVMDGLIAAFPSAEDDFRANAESFGAELDALDDSFEAAFGENGTCAVAGQEKTVVANHNAYSYIAVRYDIQFVTVHGLDPEGEPSPEDIANVVEHINEEGMTVLFVEEYTDAASVGSIVQDTGVTIEYLYTMEMAPIDSNDDYMSLMSKNLANLESGLGC